MKKFLALVLALVLAFTLVACSGGDSSTPAPANSTPANDAPADAGNDAAGASDLEPVTLRIWFHGSNVTPEASEKVMAEVNAYLKDKINVTLEPIWGTWGDFPTTVPTALAGGDDVDIYFTCNWSEDEYNQYARDGYWVKLDDLLPTYGADLLDIIPDNIWECCVTNGIDGSGIYAVPALKDTASQYCWDLNGTLAAELGYDVDEICANGIDFYSDEFEEMLAKAKEYKGGDFYPLVGEPLVYERMVNHTPIVGGDTVTLFSYFIDPEDPSKDIGSTIVNKYETEEFRKFCERMYELAQKGYVSPQTQNTGTANDYMEACRASASYLFCTQVYAFGCEIELSNSRHIDVRMIPECNPWMDATSGQGAMMAISTVSKNPERALMFLNMLNSDPELMTLMNYGVEGYTYEKNSDGTITFIDDARTDYNPWRNGMGNIRILPATSDEGADYWDRFAAYYDTGKVLPYGSYIFDWEGLDNERTALGNVYEQYGFQLMAGAVNPDDVMDEFLAKLKDAGVDAVVEAANAQING